MKLQTITRPAARRFALAIALALAGLVLIGFFSARAYRAYERIQRDVPAGGLTDVEDIRGWMTLPYIARAYDVPEDALYNALGIPKLGNERLSIKQLVEKYGRDAQTSRAQLQQALLRSQHAPSPGGATP